MSIPINQDNSVQLPYTIFPYTISNIDYYITNTQLITTSNNLNNSINLKQNTLTSSTVLLGTGGSITGIDYNNISLNTPNLSVYDTITARNTALTAYSTTTGMNTAISTALVPYSTTTGMNTAISTALVPYSTTTQMLSAIALSNLTFNTPLLKTGNTVSIDLSLYDTITARTTAINSQNVINSNFFVSSNISTNIFNNLITPYDTITARTTAINNQNIINSNFFISSNISTNIFNNLIIPYDTITARTTAINNQNAINSNYFVSSNVSTNIFNNLIAPYDTISARNTALSSYLPLSGGTMTASLTMTGNSSAFYFTGGGACLGEAGGATAFSSSSLTNDCILRARTGNQLILQSGGGGGAIIISSGNNTSIANTTTCSTLNVTNATTCSSTLNVNGILNANYPDIRMNPVNGVSLLTLEARIMGANGYSAVFGGDMYESSYWGKCVCINGGGMGDNVNAGSTKIVNTSSFSIYTRSSGTSTYFDKNLFVVRNSGNVGIGTTNPSALLELYSTTQTLPRIILSGQEFYTNTSLTTGGVALLCGVNRASNRQLWIADSTNLTQNTTNGVIRIIPNGTPSIDALATDGTTRLDMNLGGAINILANGKIGIGTTNPQYLLDVNGSANINGVLTILKDNWILSSDGILRIFFQNNGTTYFHSGNTGSDGFKFRKFAQSDIFVISDAGNVSTTGALTTSSGYNYSSGLRINGTDTANTIYNGNNNMGLNVNSGYTVNIGMNGGNGTIMAINNTSATITQPTTINSSLTAKQFYCTTVTLNFTSIVSGGTTYYGFFLFLNNWWDLGYSYLTISASITMGGQNIYCWNGRVYLSASGGILTNGGVMSIVEDYVNPSTGPYTINAEERWDGSGSNFFRFYGTFLSAGAMYIKIYG